MDFWQGVCCSVMLDFSIRRKLGIKVMSCKTVSLLIKSQGFTGFYTVIRNKTSIGRSLHKTRPHFCNVLCIFNETSMYSFSAEYSQIMSDNSLFSNSISILSRCLKITGKVSFNIASEASYVYILSRQNFSKKVKFGQIW